MNITTRFKIGDNVFMFYKYEFVIKEETIRNIHIFVNNGVVLIEYLFESTIGEGFTGELGRGCNGYKEDQLGESKQEILNRFASKYNQLIQSL